MLTAIGWLVFLVVCIRNLGLKWAVIFIFLSSAIGFTAEWFSINYGVIFGGFYYYSSKSGPQIFKVPWVVIGYWATFIFGAMGVTNYFFSKHHNFGDAFFTTLIDLPLEVVAFKTKAWVWQTGYAPIGNYVGWFLVALTVSCIFRSFYKKTFKSKMVVTLYILVLLLLNFKY